MKKLFTVLLAMGIFCHTNAQTCDIGVDINQDYTKAKELQSIMDRYTAKDLPGIAVAVYTAEGGWWAGASGYAKTETKTPMNSCNLQYIQSIAKTYMAVAVLKLHEEGKIGLNEIMTKYLPAKYCKWIRNSEKITVKMLLNHTSGIAEYVSDPEYTQTVLLTPTKVAKMEEVMKCLENEDPQFEPGTRYAYTNTNYVLLALIVNAVTGDHAKYISEKIFKPLRLNNTFNRYDKNFLNYPNLTDTYWDLLNTGRPVNISPMQRANVAALIGDDGIVCTPVDAVKFLKGLMEGKLLHDSSLQLMQEWQRNDAGHLIYGLGIARMEVDGMVGTGHGGGGIGAGCALIYIPAKKTCIFVGTNIGCIWDGPAGVKANDMKDEIFKTVLR